MFAPKSRKPIPLKPNRFLPTVEQLETRLVPAGPEAYWSDGVITITGTDDDDQIFVLTNGTNLLMGGNQIMDKAQKTNATTTNTNRINVDAKKGDDEIRLNFGAFGDGKTTGTTYVVAGPEDAGGASDWDIVIGSVQVDTIKGGDGRDILDGKEGNDQIYCGAGDDEAMGGKGEDKILGDGGHDKIYGGDNAGDTGVTATDIDTIFGGDGNDEIYGSTKNENILDGGALNDTIYGGDLDDNLYGDSGNDMLFGDKSETANGNDYLNAGTGVDDMYGMGGDDTLDGGVLDGQFDLFDGGTETSTIVNFDQGIDLEV